MQPAAFFLYVFLIGVSAPDSTPARSEWPENIWVQPQLRASVMRLWLGSPTFRAQCLKIGAVKRYRVHIVADPTLIARRRCRAYCTLRVFTSGLVMARVVVPLKNELTELIPHELEHVVEHLDGVNVRHNVIAGVDNAYEAGEGRIETQRAIKAGRQAKAEMQIEQQLSRR